MRPYCCATAIMSSMDDQLIDIPAHELAEVCRRWRIAELAVSGSVVRDDAGPESDIDLLVSFEAGDHWSTLDLARLIIELENLLGRKVDLVEERSLKNPFKRRAILEDRRILYAA